MHTNDKKNREIQLWPFIKDEIQYSSFISVPLCDNNDIKYSLKFKIDRSSQNGILAEENILTFASQNLSEETLIVLSNRPESSIHPSCCENTQKCILNCG